MEQVDRGQPLEEARGRSARRRRRRRCGGSAPAAAAASRSRPSGRPRAPPWRPASPASSCRCPTSPKNHIPRPRVEVARRARRRNARTALTATRVRVARHVGDRRAVEGDAAVLGAGSPRRRPRAPRLRDRARRGTRRARATSSSPRIQPEPSQTPSGQAGSRHGSLRAIAGVSASGAPPRPTSSSGGPSPAGCSTGSLLARRGRRTSGSGRGRRARTSPIGPLRCLAMISSATPGSLGLVVGSVVLVAVDEDDEVGVLLDRARLAQVGEDRALVRCAARGRGRAGRARSRHSSSRARIFSPRLIWPTCSTRLARGSSARISCR